MDLLKKHVDTCIILTSVIGSFLWMNGRFNQVDKEIGSLKTEVAIVKTVLLMKNIMPAELCHAHEKEKQ